MKSSKERLTACPFLCRCPCMTGSRRFKIPKDWLASVRAWMREHRVSQERLAEMAGLNQGTISKFLRNRGGTIDVAVSVSRATGIALPPITEEPEYELWLDIGHRMRRIDAAWFQRELAELLAIVEAHERKHHRRASMLD